LKMFNKLEARVLSEYKRSRAAPSTFCTLIKHYFSFIKHYIKLLIILHQVFYQTCYPKWCNKGRAFFWETLQILPCICQGLKDLKSHFFLRLRLCGTISSIEIEIYPLLKFLNARYANINLIFKHIISYMILRMIGFLQSCILVCVWDAVV
jgi:hypothetical protein